MAAAALAAAAGDAGASAAVGVGLRAGAAVVVAGAAAVAGDGAPPQRAVADVAAVALQEAAVRLGGRGPELTLVVFVFSLAAALADRALALPAAGGEEAVELHVVVPAGDGRRGGGGGDGEREEQEQGEALGAGHGAAAAAGRGRGNECAWGSVQRGLSCPGVTRGEEELGSGGMGASGCQGGSLITRCRSLSRGSSPRMRTRAW